MSATASAPSTTPQSNHHSQPHTHRHRRPRTPRSDPDTSSQSATSPEAQQQSLPTRNRGGRVGRAFAGRDRSLAFRPASVAPPAGSHDPSLSAAANAQGQVVPASNAPPQVRPGRARGRGTGRHHGRYQQSIIQTREFGGALTTPSQDYNAGLSQLSPLQSEPVEFQPSENLGVPTTSNPRMRQRQHQPQKRRLSKSTAPDIATRIHEDITNRQYECPICTSEVLKHSKVWSCGKCWTVFHLDCIKKWSSNADSGVQQPNLQNDDTPLLRQWRCPGCNLPQDVKPGSYTCWCGKEHDPRPLSGLPPHSCGQTCGRPRELPKKCPHPCELLCHAGPCPPCTHIGPTQRCFCGKESTTRRCVETQYDGGWSCGKPCGDIMPCGEHACQRDCHEGLCGACEVRVDARCYCGKEEKSILCCDKDDEIESHGIHVSDTGEKITEDWTGLFKCTNTCDRFFDCGKHQCTKPCHAQVKEVEHCPRSPDVVTECPCGKTELTEISDQVRHSCEDPIPNCSKVCMKQLSCGHPCPQVCHTDECMPCLRIVSISCRCGRTESTTMCHQGTEEPPQCFRLCKTTLNCGRHECGERCCPGERKGTERQASKKKSRPLNSTTRPLEDSFEAEHICTRPCGRLLKCGNHLCQELCHKGPCGSCREAIFDEISCHCGRTVLEPPLPCGTDPPPCRYDCERTKACGHPQVPHHCHSDEEACPKCPFLTEKPCLCGKKSLKNQQCWFTDVRCGDVCGKKLKCGSHSCRKTCHKPGECEDAGGSCQQACGKEKKVCGHPCEDTCHAPYPCREEKPCTHKVIITCDCQHHKQEMRCGASRTSDGNTKKSLKCDDECARLERNRKLALALNIDPATHKDDHIPYSAETLAMFQEHPKWCQEQEREFRVFATDDSEKRLRFKPMPTQQRAFLHALAEDFGFDSESMDPEPHRHVAVFKTPRFVSAPNKTLRECLRIRQSQQMAAAEAHAAAAKAKSSILTEPYNGFLITAPRFALTIDELASELAAVQGPTPRLVFSIQFLGTGDVALRAVQTGTLGSDRAVDITLKELRHPLARAFTAQGLGTLQLCRFDADLTPTRRELDTASGGGWSQVAAKAAAPRGMTAPVVPPVGVKSAFTVLGSLVQKKKQQQEEAEKVKKAKEKVVSKMSKNEPVVEDWEVAEGLAEEKEKEEEQQRRSGEIDRDADIKQSTKEPVSEREFQSAPETELVSQDKVVVVDGGTDAVETLAAAPVADPANDA